MPHLFHRTAIHSLLCVKEHSHVLSCPIPFTAQQYTLFHAPSRLSARCRLFAKYRYSCKYRYACKHNICTYMNICAWLIYTQTAGYKTRQSKMSIFNYKLNYLLASSALIASVRAGTILFRSPTTP